MNARQLNLILLWGNLGLAVVVVLLVLKLRSKPQSSVVTRPPVVIENTVTQIAVRKFNATNLLAELSNRPSSWQTIESTNYFTYIRNLRAIGCPEETIRDIILTDLARLYGRRLQEVMTQVPPFEYWRTIPEGQSDNLPAELRRQLESLEAERNQVVKDLLRVDFNAELAKYKGVPAAEDRQLAFLDPAKRSQVRALLESYERLMDEATQGGGPLLPEDQARLRELQSQQEAELAKLLTPDELAMYELSASPLARQLRHELHGFSPSAEEFQSVYRTRKTFDEVIEASLGSDLDLDPAVREEAFKEASLAFDGELEKILGKERFNTYQQARDPDYRYLSKWAERAQLPGDVAGQVYQMKQESLRQRDTIETDPKLTAEQRQQALQAIAREAENSINGLLGEQGYRDYRRSSGNWLVDLQRVQDILDLVPVEEPPPPPAPLTVPVPFVPGQPAVPVP